MHVVDWYFDFVSPFSYLQFERLGELPGAAPTLRPVLFAGLLRHWGQLGPAEIPSKRAFTYRHVAWRARVDGVAFRFPPAHPFNPLAVLRLSIACGNTHDAVAAIFRAIWRDGRDPEADWDVLGSAVGLDGAHARELIAAEPVKQALRDSTQAAIDAGVFGVPTLVVGRELFWGVDATDMAIAYLRDPGAFDDPEMRRVGALPAAAQRRRDPGPAR